MESYKMNLFEKEVKDLMVDYAKIFIGTPYKWGGSGAGGFDCSGYIQEVLSCVGLDPKGDQTAQRLYDHFIKKGRGTGISKGSLLFWGKSENKITHVSMAIDYWHHIEAGGGGKLTVNLKEAQRLGAMVRIRPIKSRKNLFSAIKI
jgi:cell wall-associated NlpC family hydrolase